jgi:UDP-glucose 4-epimerase
MKCLVLGGGGFIGSHLSKALLEQGHAVRIFERPSLKPVEVFPDCKDLEWLEGDFLNERDIGKAVAGCEIIFHLISTTLPRSSNDNPVYDVESNLVSTLHMLESARKAGVRKVLFPSSGGTVYGIPKEIPIKECHPTDPVCSYGIGKLAIEKYLHLYHALHGLDYCVLRIGNPYGEGQRPTAAQGAVAVFLDRALNDEVIEIWGDGTVTRDYLYVGDVVQAFLNAMTYCGEHRIFNIGAGEGRSMNDLIGAIESLVRRPVTRRFLPGRPFDVPTNILDISRAKAFLGWQSKTPFYAGLSQTFDWLENRKRGRSTTAKTRYPA